MLTSEIIKGRLLLDKAHAEKKLEEWAEKLKMNPVYALEWADASFDHAATLELSTKVLHHLEYHAEHSALDAEIVEKIREGIQQDLIFRARSNTNRSTGQGQNLMDAARVTALANLYEFLTERA